MIDNVEQRILAARERANGRSGDFGIKVEQGSEVEKVQPRRDGKEDANVKPVYDTPDPGGLAAAAEKWSDFVMPEAHTSPTPETSVKVGALLAFHSDNGGFFSTSRHKVVVVGEDGHEYSDREGLWLLFQELRALAAAKQGKK